jgi:hypothetical protein
MLTNYLSEMMESTSGTLDRIHKLDHLHNLEYGGNVLDDSGESEAGSDLPEGYAVSDEQGNVEGLADVPSDGKHKSSEFSFAG